mgnify:CR=1 FL=1
MEYCLTTYNLAKSYGRKPVLRNVNMHVERGAIYGFVGKNGSGKTTLIRCVTGLQRPTSGSYELFGVSDSDGASARVRKRIAAIVETPSVYPSLSAKDNMLMQCEILGIADTRRVADILDYVGLSYTDTKKVAKYSLGMRQRLGIALALVGGPDLIILDEPVNGLDPQGIVEIRELILRLNREKNMTVVISSHILGELSKLATHYGFIDAGSIVKEISAKELADKCRKSIYVEVDDTKAFSCAMQSRGIEHRVASDRSAEIYGEITVTELVALLSGYGCSLRTVREQDEDLERYFLDLIGGERS